MYRTRSFHKDGLFSEVIFGPVKDYSCSCGKVHGRENAGVTCKFCGVTCDTSEKRRTTFAKIVIPENLVIVNPAILDMLDNIHLSIAKLKLSKLISGKQTIKLVDNEVLVGNRGDEDYEYGPVVFKEVLLPYLLDESKPFQTFYNQYKDYLFINCIPVIPPDTRPLMQSANDEKQFFSDEINEKYNNIIRQLNDIEYAPFIFQSTQTILQNKVTSLFDTLLSKFEKKTGFLRSSLLGKRIDYSGRAVITVDGYELPLGYCKVPFYIAKELFKPQLLRLLSEKLEVSSLEILKDWDKPYLREPTMDILKKIVVGKYVFLNRQPTLHRPSFQSVKVYDVIWDDVIVIHPLITESYNADFDGDQMAIYVPNSIAIKDAAEKMWVDSNKRLPSNGSITYTFKQDEVMGLSKITNESYSKKTEYFGIPTTEKRIELFKKCIPESHWKDLDLFKSFNVQLKKKGIHAFIDIAERVLDSYDWLHMLDVLCREGFSNSFGTLSIRDFVIKDPKNFNPDEVEDNSATLMIRSGARGNWDQYKQMASEKGYISDVTGKILPDPVIHSLVNGLTPEEFFTTCYGGRKGLIDTADNTAKSGYLTRRLVYLLSPLQLSDKDTCHEDKTLQFYIRDEKVAQMLHGRYTRQGKITDENYKEFAGKVVDLYSPITCTDKLICKRCYGDLFNIHKSHYIGLIAAQSLGERTTQLTLRTKHTSGSVDDPTIEFKDFFDIKNSVWKAKVNGSFYINEDTVVFTINNEEHELTNIEQFETLIDHYGDDENYYVFTSGQKVAKVTIESKDVVSAVTTLSSLLNNPYKKNDENLSIQDYIYQIIDIYGSAATVDLVHFELIIAMLCRNITDVYKPYRLHQDEGYTLIGLNHMIGLMPEQALAFERFSYHLRKYLNHGLPQLEELNDFSMLRSAMFLS
jgi:DNA-directed RNA polymerase beta' subunit